MLLLILSVLLPLTAAADNDIAGIPRVQCRDGALTVLVPTRRPFAGSLFLHGHQHDPACPSTTVEFPTSTLVKFRVDLSLGPECGMREGPVEGVAGHSILSVLVHLQFLGGGEGKVFRASCVFPDSASTSAAYLLSPVSTKELVSPNDRTPNCSYTVRRGGPEGEVVTYSSVGEKTYHVWECENEPERGFLVRSCYATDGLGKKIRLYDKKVDPIVMPDVRYSGGLRRAYTIAHGFKFSDVSTLALECLLEFCRKDAGECLGLVPPRCSNLFKRHSPSHPLLPPPARPLLLRLHRNHTVLPRPPLPPVPRYEYEPSTLLIPICGCLISIVALGLYAHWID